MKKERSECDNCVWASRPGSKVYCPFSTCAKERLSRPGKEANKTNADKENEPTRPPASGV
jgi:hypothetical protein